MPEFSTEAQEPTGAETEGRQRQDEIAQLNQLIETLQQQLARQNRQIGQLEDELVDLRYDQQNDRQRLRLLEEAFQRAPLAQLQLDLQGHIVACNEKAAVFFQRQPEVLERTKLQSLLSRKALHHLLPVLRQLNESPHNPATVIKLLLERQDATPFLLLLAYLPHSDLLLALIQDLSLTAIAEQSDELARFALEQLREGVMITDRNGIILRINHAFSEITGYRAEEVCGHSATLLHSGRQDGSFYDKMWQSLRHHGWWAGELYNRRKNGEIYPQWLQICRIEEPLTRQLFYVGTFSDISDRKQQQQTLDRLAYYDPLTGLPNRCFLEQALRNQLARASSQDASGFCLLFIDLDRFKEVNDRFGHQEGDLVLKEAAQRITACVRDSDLVARIGGDEFVVLLPRLHNRDPLNKVTSQLLKTLQHPFEINDHRHHLGASIGAAFYPQHGQTQEDLLRRADAAMYRAKEAGRNRWRLFDPAEESHFLLLDDHKKFVWRVLEEPERFIHMHFQHIRCGRDAQRLFALEALLRLHQQQQEGINTQDFILAVEKNHLMEPLGEAIFAAICLFARQLDDADIDLPLCVNLSAQQIQNAQMVERLQQIARQQGVQFERCYFEITETAAMDNMARMRDSLGQLRDCGCRILLDDFGTGYASLLQLRDLPIDLIKLDKSFVAGIGKDRASEVVIEAMLAMSRAMQLGVVAEGVEQPHQADWLRAAGVDALQGYLFNRPCDGQTLLKELKSHDLGI
ncbi:bifunctional diguanylate cyclase/phosphodiesterase [Desulfuromonas thiophila]|uniref:PAS domain S-box-containing protein/diguanylate cyclase (GGDEF) domain-containing protein n=1 Tax=Desulfuromonas thiophila TaxID=57664 RepID=A0A1G7CXL9_9BACT|nr:bifunctional diguanylate cyclase/phosphodiesterase [Desulfuromonas thiophila]SDE43530.1 PAS domain S-box-containing protein/diguanylate cyclase (GGDEF) domain-containing protein [Desulfuromonas thiophila]